MRGVKDSAEPQLTESEKAVLAMISGEGWLPLDELTDNLEEVRHLIQVGLLRLLVSSRAWGLEFNIEVNSAPIEDNQETFRREVPPPLERIGLRAMGKHSKIEEVYR